MHVGRARRRQGHRQSLLSRRTSSNSCTDRARPSLAAAASWPECRSRSSRSTTGSSSTPCASPTPVRPGPPGRARGLRGDQLPDAPARSSLWPGRDNAGCDRHRGGRRPGLARARPSTQQACPRGEAPASRHLVDVGGVGVVQAWVRRGRTSGCIVRLRAAGRANQLLRSFRPGRGVAAGRMDSGGRGSRARTVGGLRRG
jgi:hypothetical protein